jgi:trehalose/maltose hydrolase-like predicted phosphorylase
MHSKWIALYNLYSFIRPETRQSIAMGLSSQGYNGHIWDSELWMYPTLWPCNPIWQNLVSIIVLIVCKSKQKATVYGYKGAMFPWESDDTGEEATPGL